MNRLDTKTRAQIVRCLVDGNSIRATTRIVGVSKNTVVKLLCELGAACRAHHDATVRGVTAKRVQCDEIWSFVYAKDKNLTQAEKNSGEKGSMWTWTAIDADSKLVISYLIGARDAGYAWEFMKDVAERLANRVQLTTDGHKPYLAAVDAAFAGEIDYAMLVKTYGDVDAGAGRYSPPACTGIIKNPISGCPESDHVSTSYVERQNLTMRMAMRRFTRLTNAFSKKVANLEHAVSLHFAYYNFCRVHQTLKVTPAMEAGLADHIWSVDDLIALIPEREVAAWGSKSGRSSRTDAMI
jgi:IS1 family transposase